MKTHQNLVTLDTFAGNIEISVNDLVGPRRQEYLSLARQTYWYYLKEHGYRLIDIADMFNRKRHSTIISGINTVKNLISAHDPLVTQYWSTLNGAVFEN